MDLICYCITFYCSDLGSSSCIGISGEAFFCIKVSSIYCL